MAKSQVQVSSCLWGGEAWCVAQNDSFLQTLLHPACRRACTSDLVAIAGHHFSQHSWKGQKKALAPRFWGGSLGMMTQSQQRCGKRHWASCSFWCLPLSFWSVLVEKSLKSLTAKISWRCYGYLASCSKQNHILQNNTGWEHPLALRIFPWPHF